MKFDICTTVFLTHLRKETFVLVQNAAMSRLLLLFLAILQVVLFAGAVYGWPALRQVLEDHGVLADRCRGEHSGVDFSHLGIFAIENE